VFLCASAASASGIPASVNQTGAHFDFTSFFIEHGAQ
jgi:hypothetical protein